jgi:hypothetical protein
MAEMIDGFALRFRLLDKHSRSLLERLSDERLFARPRQIERSMTPFSCGEYIVRSAAVVEKTFGGITTRLWDDPFEWTLPEALRSVENVLNYLDEVERARSDGFGFFTSDDDLTRQIPSPEKLRTIFDVLLEAIAHAEHFQGRAYAIFQMLTDETLPRIDR